MNSINSLVLLTTLESIHRVHTGLYGALTLLYALGKDISLKLVNEDYDSLYFYEIVCGYSLPSTRMKIIIEEVIANDDVFMIFAEEHLTKFIMVSIIDHFDSLNERAENNKCHIKRLTKEEVRQKVI